MSVLYQNYNTDDNASAQANDTRWIAQTFTTAKKHIITHIKLKLWRDPTLAPGTVTASIRATDGSGHPTGNDLASGTIDGDTLPTTDATAEWTTITFTSPYTLEASTKYAIVLRCSGSGDYPLNWRDDTTSPTYANGNYEYSSNSGSSWNGLTSADLMFEEYGTKIPIDLVYSKKLIAVSNDEVWYESSAGTMSELAAANGDIDTAEHIQIFPGLQKVFIANESNLKVIDFANTKLSTADILPAGKTLPSKGDTIGKESAGSMSDPQFIVDYITATDAAASVYAYKISGGSISNGDILRNSDDSIHFTVNADEVAAPHWYTWTPYANDITNYGSMPTKATLGCLYRGRCVLAGNEDSPHQWCMSGVTDPWNWLYVVNDPLSPIRGGNANAGQIGDIVTALIPYEDDYLIFGGGSSIYIMVGDPALGGSIDLLTNNTGIYGKHAWCFDDNHNLYFFGFNGLYRCSPGAPIGEPENISETALPNWIADWNLDSSKHTIVLSFDPVKKGIIISKTDLTTGANSNYWYDLKTNGFFPEKYPNDCGMFSSFAYNAIDVDYKKLLIGCNDGYIREFDNTTKSDIDADDASIAIDSYSVCPVLALSSDSDRQGKLNTLSVVNAGGASGGNFSDTDSLNLNLYVGDCAEEVLEDIVDDATAFYSVAINSVGRKTKIRTRVRGAYLGVKVYNSVVDETWAIERMMGEVRPAGKIR